MTEKEKLEKLLNDVAINIIEETIKQFVLYGEIYNIKN